MKNHAMSKHSFEFEESASLLEEKSLSDIESDAGRADIEARFSPKGWANVARTGVASVRGCSPLSMAKRTAFFLLPSFIQARILRDSRSHNDRLGPTAYLDGMRGVAAFFVFFCHYTYTCFIIAQGWGFGETNFHILKLPFIRLLYSGPPMVCVFFVISGYALSLKPLKLIRSRSAEGFATTMTSFVFRRGVRLFLPTAVSTFMIVVMLRVGLYEWTRDFAYDKVYMKNVQETHPARLGTTVEQLLDWGRAMFDFIHVWGWERFGGSTAYDVHLWTIPVEFRCSMMLFLTLIGVARLRTCVRFVVMAGVMWFTYRSDRWEMLLFLAGMILAELDLIRQAHTRTNATASTLPVNSPLSLLAQTTEVRPRWRLLRSSAVLWSFLSLLALFFMSQPDTFSEQTPGWIWLTSLIPAWFSEKYRYWQMIGSVLFVASVARVPPWQKVFNTGLAQYLGKISYAIYLVHGPVLHTVGYTVERAAWRVTGVEGTAYNWGFFLASLAVVPMVVWAADVFWRAVDAPSVRFAKWLEARCSASD